MASKWAKNMRDEAQRCREREEAEVVRAMLAQGCYVDHTRSGGRQFAVPVPSECGHEELYKAVWGRNPSSEHVVTDYHTQGSAVLRDVLGVIDYLTTWRRSVPTWHKGLCSKCLKVEEEEHRRAEIRRVSREQAQATADFVRQIGWDIRRIGLEVYQEHTGGSEW